MRKLIFLAFLISCAKNQETQQPKTYQRSSFSSYIYMGNDTLIPRTDSITFVNYQGYIATCGVNPQYEAPDMGIKIYPIIFPSYCYMGWTTYQGRQVPYAKISKTGLYTFVGNIHIYGFRPCDSTYQNVFLCDTINVEVSKKSKLNGKN